MEANNFIEIGGKKALLEIDSYGKRVAILITGVGGKALIDPRYSVLSKELVKNDISFLRIDIWKDYKELEKLSISEILIIIQNAVDFLIKSGFEEIFLKGKSFGGGLSLIYNSNKIKKSVLWAPAISFDKISNVEEFRDKKLMEIKNVTDLKINKEKLEENKIPKLIIHGTKDEVISLENSKKIVNSSKNASLIMIENADHAYSKEEWLNEVVLYKVRFLAKH